MPSALDSIPNSSGVSSVLNNLLSFCCQVLKNARSLPGSSHMVTSLIKPQMGSSLLSRTPPLLIAVGAFAALGAVCWIATKILFRKQPPIPPSVDLPGRAAVVTPSPVSAGTNSGTDAGSLTPLPTAPVSTDAQRIDAVAPAPVPVSADANVKTSETSLPPPPAAPGDLSERTVVTLPPVPADTNVRTGEKSLPPPPTAPVALSEKTDAVTPSPGSASTNGGAGAGSLPSVRGEDAKTKVDGEEKLPPPVGDQPGAGLSIPSIVTQVNSEVKPHSPGDDPIRPGSAPLPLTKSSTPPATGGSSPSLHISSALVETEPSSPNPSAPTSPNRASPPGSPPSSEDGRRSSSDSEIETKKRSPSPTPASAMERLVGAVTYIFSTERHFTKWTKYRLIQEQLEHFTRNKNVGLCTPKQGDSTVENEITAAWNDLIKALLQPTSFTTPDDQYRKTVTCLRKTWQLLNFSNKETKKKFEEQLQFVRKLSDVRFAGIELFPYCQQLVEYASGKSLPANLTLATFLTELEYRTTVLKRPAKSTAMNPVACEMNKAKGAANIDFDPLLKTSDIPYQDGRITVNDRSTLILWHGTPVEQHDPYGLIFDLAAGALSYIPFPFVKKLISEGNPVSSPPVINADYVAFIVEAARQGKIILHVILENGEKTRTGDESGRVKARLRLAVYHQNFFAIALRLDGKFFERHDEYMDQIEPINHLKERLKEQLLMPIGNFENQDMMTASTVTKIQMDDQLTKNGFCIPQKLRDACKLEKNIDFLLDEVQQIYFPDKDNIPTQIKKQEEHQAFLLLSYVHIILFACWKIDPSILDDLCKDDQDQNKVILEAGCKNDKDRGNVIKTILKLHFLYITGQISHETLTSVLVHTLARPFILQKAPIIKSRLVLLERVIPFIKAAHERVPVPPTRVFGEPVKTASYVVVKPPGQTIYPNNATSKTVEEYRAFLEHHQPVLIPPHDAAIQQKTSAEQESAYDRKGVHQAILAFLCSRSDFAEKKALSASCSLQVLYTHLNGIFENHSLGISLKLDKKNSSTQGYGFCLRVGADADSLKLDAFFTISNGTVRYGNIKASMTINDQTGQAQFKYILV